MSDELYHYGVKGMKWGIRRKRAQSSSNNSRSPHKKITSDDAKRFVKNGAEKTKAFLKTNGPTIAKTAGIIALSSVGATYAAVALSNLGGLDMSAFGVSSTGYQSVPGARRVEIGPIKSAGPSAEELLRIVRG